jgi:hypothetical protein
MIEVLGWVLLAVVILYLAYVVVLAIAIGWTAAGYEPPHRSVPTTQCIVCGMLAYDGERCACGPIFKPYTREPDPMTLEELIALNHLERNQEVVTLKVPAAHVLWPVTCKHDFSQPMMEAEALRKFSEAEVCVALRRHGTRHHH